LAAATGFASVFASDEIALAEPVAPQYVKFVHGDESLPGPAVVSTGADPAARASLRRFGVASSRCLNRAFAAVLFSGRLLWVGFQIEFVVCGIVLKVVTPILHDLSPHEYRVHQRSPRPAQAPLVIGLATLFRTSAKTSGPRGNSAVASGAPTSAMSVVSQSSLLDDQRS
jgi:hypothetical protein